MAAGPSDISVILSQAGRIEKVLQNTFAQSEVARQILTEEEARARMQKAREVVEAGKAQEITISDEARQKSRRHMKGKMGPEEETREAGSEGRDEENAGQAKRLIDVVV